MTVTYFILNVTVKNASHSAPMDTSQLFMFGNICACFYVSGNISKYNPPSLVDITTCLFRHFELIIFVVGRTLFMRADTAIKFICAT